MTQREPLVGDRCQVRRTAGCQKNRQMVSRGRRGSVMLAASGRFRGTATIAAQIHEQMKRDDCQQETARKRFHATEQGITSRATGSVVNPPRISLLYGYRNCFGASR